MELDEQEIRNEIGKCLADSYLPREVSLDNEEVLKLIEYKKHHSLVFVDKLLFRVIGETDHYILEFQREYENFLSGQKEPSDRWLKRRLESIGEIVTLKDNIRNILEYELKRTHGEPFGCCSQYLVCSDARKCIHDDFLFSLGCQYRLNLMENRIFYGKNTNF